MQLESISAVVEDALKGAKIKKREIDLIAVTNGPGLLGSLLVGISFAKSVSLALNLPLIGVNHLHAHIYASLLGFDNIRFPFIALVVSGGHTSLYFVKSFTDITLLGGTQDDACGEAFDKVAKILKLGYPGGPLIEKISRGVTANIKFSCSGTVKPLNFSFSGIKTAVLYQVKNQNDLNSDQKRKIAASFQEAAIMTLINKSLLAANKLKVSRLVVGGGVIMNGRLREEFKARAQEAGIKCYFPAKDFSTDNAAMVAGIGSALFKSGRVSNLNLNTELN